jgi:hypothetical protein
LRTADAQPRSGDRLIAWGVSPRRRGTLNTVKPGTGDRLARMSVAASRLVRYRMPFLGLAPQAIYLSRLRR